MIAGAEHSVKSARMSASQDPRRQREQGAPLDGMRYKGAHLRYMYST